MSAQSITALLCIILSAFFSASEMALSSANRLRLSNLADDGNTAAAVALKLIDRFDDVLSAILIGNNFVNIALSSLASVIAIRTLGEGYTWLATVIVTAAVIIFGETIPKIISKKTANRFLTVVSPLLQGLTLLLKPLTALVLYLVNLLTAPLKGEGKSADGEAAVEELQSIIDTAEDEAVIDSDRGELLHAALDFEEISASEVMTARVDMEALDIDTGWEETFALLSASGHSRIPVYENSVDNIVGVLHLNRFFKALLDVDIPRPDIRRMLMPPCYIYKSTKLPAVLEQLRKARQHLAIVSDEYGGVLGIVTMEDVLEKIVGDIWDENDEVDPELVKRPDGTWEIDGDMSVGDFTKLLDIKEEDFRTESATVGGWALEQFGAFPEAGQSFTWEGLITVTVLAMDGLRVDRLLVSRDT